MDNVSDEVKAKANDILLWLMDWFETYTSYVATNIYYLHSIPIHPS
jgi:hypothetical protein